MMREILSGLVGPNIRRRFRRFRHIKRAWWSLWILLGIYLLSLFAVFWANDQPLIARSNGKLFFPILKTYSQNELVGDGVLSQANYKALAKRDHFKKDKSNWMWFPLVPFGPKEVIVPADVDLPDEVEVCIFLQRKVAAVMVDRELVIQRAQGISSVLEGRDNSSVKGLSLEALGMSLEKDFYGAINKRFNQYSEKQVEREYPFELDSEAFVAKLFFREARDSEPKLVRVAIEEAKEIVSPAILTYESGVFIKTNKPGTSICKKLTDSQKSEILTRIEEVNNDEVRDLNFDLADKIYTVRFKKERIAFPFRPTKRHWMGLDSSGRDVFTQVVHATRIALSFGFILVLATMLIGILIGSIQGFFGGKIDLFGQRFIEIWEAIPFLYVMMLLGAVFGKSFGLLLVVYGIFNWIGLSYFVRSEFFKFRKSTFVEAAQVMGLPKTTLMFRHILPNALVPLVTFFPFSLVGAIGSLSALDFLGFGLPAGTPSWGALLSQAREYPHAWWLIVFPASALFVVTLLGVFIGEGLRSAFDPKSSIEWDA